MKKTYTLIFLLIQLSLYAEDYHIYLDADQTPGRGLKSSESITWGIKTALSEIDYKVQGYHLKLVIKNHRGSSPRSKFNLQEFQKDPKGLIVFSGMHSPPILANKSFINDSKILLLDPWAAAGPITRSANENNSIFRLSIDDSQAGTFITNTALKEGFNKPYLLLEDTGWGKSNFNTMTKALKEKGLEPIGVSWFNWGIGESHAKLIIRDIQNSPADVIFFVGNAPEGAVMIKTISQLSNLKKIPVRSHWGITGGSFFDDINGYKTLESVDLKFIQTQFSFLNSNLSPFQSNVFTQLKTLNPSIKTTTDLKAPTGFIHAYDLTKLLIETLKATKLSGNAKKDSLKLKENFYQLKSVQGLIKQYDKPFKPNSDQESNGHEALSIQDYAMGFFDKNGVIRILESN